MWLADKWVLQLITVLPPAPVCRWQTGTNVIGTKIVIFTINEFYVVKRVFGVLRGSTPKQSGAGGLTGASDDY